MDLSIYKIDLDTDQPNGGKGESPRSAFAKYNNSLDAINGELTTLGENVDTINGELTTLGENVDTINGELTTLGENVDTINGELTTLGENVDTINGELTTLGTATTNALSEKADNTITISAGTGLSGGGDLTENRTFNVKYGTTEGTAAQGDDERIVNAVQTSGNQTVAGIKTFSTFPVTPSTTPTTNYQVANKKYVDDSAIGVGQSWQNMTGSRSWGTTYTNTSGKPIMIAVTVQENGSGDMDFELKVGGLPVASFVNVDNTAATATAIVPPGSSYLVNRDGNNNIIYAWSELR